MRSYVWWTSIWATGWIFMGNWAEDKTHLTFVEFVRWTDASKVTKLELPVGVDVGDTVELDVGLDGGC